MPISAVRVERRPVYLVFLARSAGTFHLLTGNKLCAAPRYDLAALGANLKNVAVTPVKISAAGGQSRLSRAGSAGRTGSDRRGARRFRVEISQARPNFPRRRAAGRTGSRRAVARGWRPCGFARVARQQPGAFHRPAHLHQPRDYAGGHGDERREKSEVEPLAHQAAQIQFAAHAPDVRDDHAAVPALDDTFRRSTPTNAATRFTGSLGSATWTQTPDRKTKEFSLPLNSVAAQRHVDSRNRQRRQSAD